MKPPADRRKPPVVPIITRVTEDERERLKDLIWQEGYNSISAWIRQQIVRKIREGTLAGQG